MHGTAHPALPAIKARHPMPCMHAWRQQHPAAQRGAWQQQQACPIRMPHSPLSRTAALHLFSVNTTARPPPVCPAPEHGLEHLHRL